MTVCKYFQQGYCRFGQNCRFDHIYGSKYSYHAPQSHTQNQSAPQGGSSVTGVTDEQLVNQVQTDLQSALKGGQWVLSCYAPYKEKPIVPGISDLSPEEARLFIYEAKANNTLDQAMGYMNKMIKEAQTKYEQLLYPSPQIINVLRSLYKGEATQSPFTNEVQTSAFGDSSNSASNIFRGALQNTSGYGQNNTNVFASSPDSAKSIFSQATQNVFGPAPTQSSTNVFGPSPDASAKSIFAQANQNVQPNQNVFASPPQANQNPSNIFASATQQFFSQQNTQINHGNPFEQNNTSPFQNSAPSNVFQQSTPQNVFNKATTNFFDQPDNDSGIYSTEEELPAEVIEAFKSEKFQLGFIPEVPPSMSLCINK